MNDYMEHPAVKAMTATYGATTIHTALDMDLQEAERVIMANVSAWDKGDTFADPFGMFTGTARAGDTQEELDAFSNQLNGSLSSIILSRWAERLSREQVVALGNAMISAQIVTDVTLTISSGITLNAYQIADLWTRTHPEESPAYGPAALYN